MLAGIGWPVPMTGYRIRPIVIEIIFTRWCDGPYTIKHEDKNSNNLFWRPARPGAGRRRGRAKKPVAGRRRRMAQAMPPRPRFPLVHPGAGKLRAAPGTANPSGIGPRGKSGGLDSRQLLPVGGRQSPEPGSFDELLFVGGVGQGRMGLAIGKVKPDPQAFARVARAADLALFAHVSVVRQRPSGAVAFAFIQALQVGFGNRKHDSPDVFARRGNPIASPAAPVPGQAGKGELVVGQLGHGHEARGGAAADELRRIHIGAIGKVEHLSRVRPQPSAAPRFVKERICGGLRRDFGLPFAAYETGSEVMSRLIAIVGRPNVGKSALFNRIAGRRIAIVHDQPGVTRDRVAAEVEWQGHPFTLVDTGGIGLLRREKAEDVIVKAALEQVELAIEAADVIILVVNVQEGLLPLDREAAARLRRSGKPVLVAVNKADTDRAESGVPEFAALGFPQMFPVSAIHGKGIEPLMQAAMSRRQSGASPAAPGVAAESPGEVPGTAAFSAPGGARPAALKLAIVGRPNVGKSSIINALTRSERVVVSPIPGTTRDAVDVPFEVETEGVRQSYVLIDTAGLRKTRRVGDSIEFFSVKRAEESIARCDIVILVLDAEAGITEQDKKIADRIVENHRACIVVINKWDLMDDAVRAARRQEIRRRQNPKGRTAPNVMTTLGEFGQWVQERLFFLDYAPVIFTSAKSGFHLDRLLEAVRYVAAQLQQSIPTAILNRTLRDAVEQRQPVSAQGYRLKFFYATQVRQAPPTFLLFVNQDELFSEPYKKYLANQMRQAFGYEGCPIIIVAKPRPKTIAPVRKFRGAGRQKAG